MKELFVSFLVIMAFGFIVVANAEKEDNFYELEEITVTGTRGERDSYEIPRGISIATEDEIFKRNSITAADILREEIGVQVQKTSYGHGSPIMRGLTGYHTLILIDGVRLNNSTFRSGPNQYMATIDPGQINRIEVLRGPGSALYGSAALGGVINVITKSPIKTYEAFSISPYIFTSFSSADRGKIGRIELSGKYKLFDFIAGTTYKDIGDVRPGKGNDIQLPNKKLLITSQSQPKNLPEGAWLVDIESPTGWKERNGDMKLGFKLSDNQNLKLTYQIVRQQDVPRYDKLATKEYDIFLFNPQNRDLAYLNYTAKEIIPFINNLQASLSYHKQEEGQEQQKTGSSSFKEISDITDTLGLSLQMTSLFGEKQKITYGGEFYYDTVDSSESTTDLKTGAKKEKSWGTFPDDSKFWDLNAYLQDEIKILDNFEVSVAGRYTRFNTEADLGIRDPAFGQFQSSGDAITGSLGMIYGITKNLNLMLNLAQAFRTPSLNDTTAVTVTNEGIDAPSPDLGSEYGNGLDLGMKFRTRYFSGSAIYYFSRISGLVTRVSVDEAYADKEMPKLYSDLQESHPGVPIFVKDNIEKAIVQGVEMGINAPIHVVPDVSVYGNLSITRGRDIDNDEPIRREQPTNGLLGIRWDSSKFGLWIDFFSRFAAKQDRLSSGDIRDPRIPGKEIDPKKEDPWAYTPGWFTLNIRTGLNASTQTRIVMAVENITDKRYREHGSGVNNPGRNFIVSADQRF